MHRWYVLPGLAIVALAVACSQPSSPASPTGAETDGTGAGPGGITLKVNAPVVQSPANGALLSSLNGVTFVVSRVTGLNASFPITLEFDIARQGGPQIDNTKLATELGWRPSMDFESLVAAMVRNDEDLLAKDKAPHL